MKWIKASNLDEFVALVRENMNAAHLTPAPQPPVVVDPMEQLKKLGELRDAGLMTDEEFEMKRQEIISRM